ncbi:DUF6207 family protein [Streptomyces longisporoflavus]|uniref:DUF6207 family protein n=1 Tax=Streptomyces longisporoflavus TaxID=28044 RepID=A0ABW7R0J0_9ACTN
MSHSAHLTQPGLACIAVHAADAETAGAVAYALAAHPNGHRAQRALSHSG